MRPIRLIVQAFGPFATKQTIDFQKLGDNPLFLIAGNTGSGKSTLLDAICFALYGQTTGAEREASQMRCDYAANSDLTFVEFEFAIADKRYCINRSPTQFKPKARGDGFTEHKTEAWLQQCFDDTAPKLLEPKRSATVTRLVEQLTGLTVQQFRQVMVLPQGKFRELLLADSKDREKIFSQLFQTQIYQRLETALKEKAATVVRTRSELLNQEQGLLASAELESRQQLTAQMQQVTDNVAAAQAHLENKTAELSRAQATLDAATTTQTKFEQLHALQQQLSKLRQQDDTITKLQSRLSLAQSAQLMDADYSAWQQALSQLKETSDEQQQLQSRLQRQQQDHQMVLQEREQCGNFDQAIADQRKQLAGLEQSLTLRKRWQQLDQQLIQAQNAHQTAVNRASRSRQAHETLRQQLHDSEAALKALTPILAKSQSIVTQWHDTGALAKAFDKKQQLVTEISLLSTQLNQQRVDYMASREQVTQLQRQQRTLEMRWHQNQAASIAKQLQQDSPCPVCGSLDHPNPAQNDEAVSEAMLEHASNELTKATERLLELEARGGSTKAKQQALQEQLQGLEQQWPQLVQLQPQQLQQLEQQHLGLFQQLQSAETQQQQLSKQRDNLLEQEKPLATELENNTKTALEKEKAVAVIQQQRLDLEQHLPESMPDLDDLTQQINHCTSTIESLQAQSRVLDDKLKQSEQSIAHLKGQIVVSAKQLENRNKACEQTELTWQSALQQSDFATEAAFVQARQQQQQIEQWSTAIDDYHKRLHTLQGQIQQLANELQEKQPLALEPLQSALQNSQQAHQLALDEYHQHQQAEKQLVSLQQKLQETQVKLSALEHQYELVGTLADVASGHSSDKVSIQRFVLSVLLDDVLIQASQRLLIMSQGRYQLLRKSQRAKGNKASGLELEVEDSYTGRTRSVATLSGGESFMAALSLALGLSEVVQSYAGGIRLNTLFIDEGFGSLDPESLDLAIRTLIDLQHSGRTIGIISHVAELKEQMTIRLEIDEQRQGSRIRIVGVDNAL
ncbi:AAA family ATPase [Paraferrimonas haliotis]|uniref:Nuclease SbcCD subunit C n=1 Tax=Paraferrimonas haliotis TaxID=2013866 RepID=A0AA37TTB8_9GAMM|nr:SMC family ATPase [Paraferrimonas haliotis]GLS82659.1 nuclease SbcCD subunit C [Paraferrimonas haliotis]